MGNLIPFPNNKYSGITLYHTTDIFIYDAHKSWDMLLERHMQSFYIKEFTFCS